MTRTGTVFSLIREQSIFMTAIMSLLTFLSVLALGVSLSIGTGVLRWNSQWELFATVQAMDSENAHKTAKFIESSSEKIESVTKITTDQMDALMAPWISGGSVLERYLPHMWEIQFTDPASMTEFGEQVSAYARFLPHSDALHSSTSAGWKMILMATFILILTLGTIGICISYIARNTAMLHRRELEILNQIGASDKFVAHQMQIIVGKICLVASGIGFIVSVPVLLLILSTAHSARVGLMAMLGLSGGGWFTLALLPVSVVIFSIYITGRTTIKILRAA